MQYLRTPNPLYFRPRIEQRGLKRRRIFIPLELSSLPRRRGAAERNGTNGYPKCVPPADSETGIGG